MTMPTREIVTGTNAKCFITIDGTRYNFMNMIDFESKAEKEKTEVPILGRQSKGNVTTGWKGTFSGTAHYNTSVFREVMKHFADTGEDMYFDIQVTTENKSGTVGRQTIIHKGCNLDEVILAKFDSDSEYLTEEVSGTFEDFEMPEKFAHFNGFM